MKTRETSRRLGHSAFKNQHSLMVPWRPPSSAAPSAAVKRRGLVGCNVRVFARFGLQCAPVCDDVGPIAVNLEPRDGFGEDCTMKQRALSPRGSLGVQQTRLHGE